MKNTSYVMGFEFDKEDVEKIRSCDTTMRCLVDLQKNGIAIIDENFYETAYISKVASDYWSIYRRERSGTIALISDSFEEVYIG